MGDPGNGPNQNLIAQIIIRPADTDDRPREQNRQSSPVHVAQSAASYMTMRLMHWNGVPDDFNLHRASSHEAAHFVIARKFGVQNVKAYMACNGLTSPWAGTVSCPVDDAQPTTTDVRRYIALAGFIVEEMHDNPGIAAADMLLKLDEQRNGRALFLSLADAVMAEGFDLSHVTFTQELVVQHRAEIEEAAAELRESALTSSEMVGSIG